MEIVEITMGNILSEMFCLEYSYQRSELLEDGVSG